MEPVEATTAITEPESPGNTPLPDTEPMTFIKSKPDELRLAVVDSDRNLHSRQEGGSLKMLVNSGDVSQAVLSPDGEWIVFTRSSPDYIDISLWAIRFDGSDQKLLVSHADFKAMPLHPDLTDASSILTVGPNLIKFIPGTHTVVFNTYGTFGSPDILDNKDLWYVHVDTEERRAFLSPGQAGYFYFSPDGTQMALVTPDRIDLLNTDGSNRRIGVLSYAFVYTLTVYGYQVVPVWSPDSSFLRVSIPSQDRSEDQNALVNIYHLPVDGSQAILLTSVVVASRQNTILAPDANHFFYKEQIGDRVENLYALKFSDLSEGSPSEFITGSIGFGSWAPDSSHFSFNSSNTNETFIGQVGVPGVIAVDVSPVMRFSWITSDQFVMIHQSGTNYQLRLGTLSTPSVEIANLGSELGNLKYDFVSP